MHYSGCQSQLQLELAYNSGDFVYQNRYSLLIELFSWIAYAISKSMIAYLGAGISRVITSAFRTFTWNVDNVARPIDFK